MAVFDTKSPHMRVVLKGEGLRLFLSEVERDVRIQEAETPKALKDIGLIQYKNSAARAIATKLTGSEAEQYGLDAGDLLKLVARESGVSAGDIDADTIREQIFDHVVASVQTGDEEGWKREHSEETRQHNGQKMALNVAALELLGTFCKCVAWQEKAEGKMGAWNEYVALQKAQQGQLFDSMISKISAVLSQTFGVTADFSKEMNAKMIIAMWAKAADLSCKYNEPKSPFVTMNRDLAASFRSAAEERVYKLYDLDPKKPKDELQFKKVWNDILAEVVKEHNFTLPPDIKR